MSTLTKLDPQRKLDKKMRLAVIRQLRTERDPIYWAAAAELEKIHFSSKMTGQAKRAWFTKFAREFARAKKIGSQSNTGVKSE
jgi:hypothetical protein